MIEKTEGGVLIRIDGLPEDPGAVRAQILELVDGPFTIQCELSSLPRVPTVAQFRALANAFDDLDVTCATIVHPPSRVIQCAKKAFFKLYTPQRPLLITKHPRKAETFMKRMTEEEEWTVV